MIVGERLVPVRRVEALAAMNGVAMDQLPKVIGRIDGNPVDTEEAALPVEEPAMDPGIKTIGQKYRSQTKSVAGRPGRDR